LLCFYDKKIIVDLQTTVLRIWFETFLHYLRKSSIDIHIHCEHGYNMNKKDKAKHTKGQHEIPGVLIVRILFLSCENRRPANDCLKKYVFLRSLVKFHFINKYSLRE
jgi:hypothetical protein